MLFKEADVLPDDFHDSMVRAKVYVGLATTMLSYMLYRCKIVPTNDPQVPTACATVLRDGNYIFVGVDFWQTLDDKKRAFLLIHEVLHIFLDHVARAKDNEYSAMLWNIATDYNINLTCSGAYLDGNGRVAYNRRYQKYLTMIEDGLYDEQYIGMSSDEIYHKLLEENDGNAKKACESVLGEGMGEYEAYMDIIPSDEESKEVEEQTIKNKQTAIEAVQNAMASKSIGENEMELVKRFEDLVKPKIHWTEHISNTFVKNAQDRTTYRIFNTRSRCGVIFPSYEGHNINIVFGIDQSGSMGYDDTIRAISELYGLLETYDSWNLHLVTCDTTAHLIGKYSSHDGDTFESINFDLVGGGGTYMTPMVEYAMEQDDINTCIILTDGYLSEDDLKMETDFGVVVVVTDKGNKDYKNDNVEVLYIEN
jgi:predicted metal-dependent peptidase